MKYMLLTGLLLGSLTVQAQVSGTVKDQAGEPIIGANVFWKNISGGVATRVLFPYLNPTSPII